MNLSYLYLDIKKSLSISYGFIKFSAFSNSFKMKINEDSLSFHSDNDSHLLSIFLKEFIFLPTTCLSLDIHFNEVSSEYSISFKVSIVYKHALSSNKIDPFDEIKSCRDGQENLKTANCGNCNANLINLVSFKNIIKEPSDESLDITESIWCPCRHHHHQSPLYPQHDCSTARVGDQLIDSVSKEKSMSGACTGHSNCSKDFNIRSNNNILLCGNSGDGIIGDKDNDCLNINLNPTDNHIINVESPFVNTSDKKMAIIHVNNSANAIYSSPKADGNQFDEICVKENSLEFNYACVRDRCEHLDEKVTCKRCTYYLGQRLENDKEIKVILKLSQLYLNIPNSNNIRLEDLRSTLKDKFLRQDCSRFIVESLDGCNKKIQHLLLWLMDSDSSYYLFDQKCGGDDAKKINCNPDNHEITLEAVNSVKVLYCPCFLDENYKTLTRSWLFDFSVECLHLDFNSVFQLLRIIRRSTESLPSHLRRTNEFYVGYL